MADLSIDQDFKKKRATSSPKSAHHAMGLGSGDLTDFDGMDSMTMQKLQQPDSQTDEE